MTNEQAKQKLTDTDKNLMVTRGKGGRRKQMWVKGVKYTVMEDLTWGGGHTIQYTDDVLLSCTLETYIISLTNVNPLN